MGKLPAFQFYPADWLNDIKLQTCSLPAQGLLINLICLMHQSEKYGYLLINGSIPTNKDVSHLLRLHHKTYQASLKELFLKGVLSTDGNIDGNNVIYCKRMVKDEQIRQVRREAGLKGGNPNFEKGSPNPYYLHKQKDKQKITPSSSSSSSSSSSKNTNIDLSSKNPDEISPPKKQKNPLCPHKKIVKLWNDNMVPLGLPLVQIWGLDRQAHLKARWEEEERRQSLEWWEGLFVKHIPKSDFLMGKVEPRGGYKKFKISFPWMIRSSNQFAKITEGFYMNREE